ncbi:DNA mismatch repair protein MutS [Desulfitobacterium dichloroeliminans LMG P-21439]|uniref:DNA mismatch repair protein MutS n=1 Tax=Desulfitobacterium dichloroeliminans (strain LMG P-21439 / DCA1) TaxID=871963 RepID=L0F8F0_DESDL|nr:DNA mismatch repair protein MutS [Desulfitobacterium dichloroeliminans]AGA69315.1 DNA mismatch repair protein MutS [Desulfitobacterium dichloroeliminans LMG P-21439]
MSTPMMQQYKSIKSQVPDAILFFRLGDFYEMFGEDAQTAAPVLEIALTGRDSGGGQRTPMCGVPHHAVEGYLVKLVNAGYKVALCEQVEDPQTAKGIVKREITRIISPGTLTDSLAEQKNNFLASVFHEQEWGLAFVDISTGEFTIFQTPSIDILSTELARIRPSELLLPSELLKSKQWHDYYLTQREKKVFQQAALEKRFTDQYETFQEFPIAMKAANGLWQYILETSPGIEPSHILRIDTYRPEHWMLLDPWTRRNLELTEAIRGQGKKGTLLSVLDFTKTAFGGRLLRRWLEQPLLVHEEIVKRLDNVESLMEDSFLRGDLIQLFSKVYDLERLIGKVSYGTANARDLLSLSQTLGLLPQLRFLLTESSAITLKRFIPAFAGLDSLAATLEQAINPEAPISLREGNLLKAGYSQEIDELRSISSGGKAWVAKLENTEKERTGIRSLKVGYNRIFGYYIEVTHTNSHLIPPEYIRKQTLANAERYITPELKEYEQKILGAEEKVMQLEYQLFLELREKVRQLTPKILEAAHALAEIDVYTSLAEAAVRYHYIRPEMTLGGDLKIIEGRHPVVESMLQDTSFVPNDTILRPEKHLALITGPNMAGKSTYMRQVALIVLMAQIGSFVPAQQAIIPIADHIFTRVGASDDLTSGQSTFMVEMHEVAHILRHVTPNSLIILDEVGRGTATYDGLSIAWAVAEYLAGQNIQPKTLFATHYHELTDLEETHPGIFNLHVGVREHGEEIVFLHKIIPGRADRSYGIQVAKLAGLPSQLLQRAKIILHELESSAHDSRKEKLFNADRMTQLSLFETQPLDPLLLELAELSVDDLTPKQALDYLFDLKERIKTSESR